MFTCIQNTNSLSGCATKSFVLVPISLRCTSRKVQTSHPHSSFDVTKAKKCRSHILRAAIIKLWWKWSLCVAFNFSLSDHFTCQIQNQHKRLNFMWFLIGLKKESGHYQSRAAGPYIFQVYVETLKLNYSMRCSASYICLHVKNPPFKTRRKHKPSLKLVFSQCCSQAGINPLDVVSENQFFPIWLRLSKCSSVLHRDLNKSQKKGLDYKTRSLRLFSGSIFYWGKKAT